MLTFRFLTSMVTASALIVLMPVTTWVHGLPTLTLARPALANSPEQTKLKFNYVPPDRGTPRRTQGTGTRGDDESDRVALKLLAPSDHTGQTVSGHPTFFWYVSEIPKESITFALVEVGVAQPIFVQQIQLDQAGIVQIGMPKNLPELVPGKEYRWSVSLINDANPGYADTFAQSRIKRVPETPELKQKLATARSDRDRASAYAEAGLWYDAVNALSLSQADSSNREAFLSLLAQAGLAEVVEQER